MGSSAFLGIDLGTTNSVAVLCDDDGKATAVRTSEGGALLPSVVRLDARGTVTVGPRARKFLDVDPDNTRGEFKRLMGSGRKLSFKAARTEKTPEELSAFVLAALRSLAAQTLGHAPESAVVTVPALFELPQTRATSEAARLAGLTHVEHLQEPVASALTAGWRSDDVAPWLVYDLGGGTFDVSLLETRDGVLRVIDHDGDNFLGGRDMDARLLDWVLAKLSEQAGRAFSRAEPALASMLRRLRTACEDAKMELGQGRDAAVSLMEPVVVDGEEVLVDVLVDAKSFGQMVRPLVDRTVDICQRLLARKGIAEASVGRIVLVGGPTVMPALRARLEERLGIRLATDVDPMTAVAEGAALFAAEHGLSTRASGAPSRRRLEAPPAAVAASVPVWLQYPSVSGDLYPFVVGRVAKGAVDTVRLERQDGGYRSKDEALDDEGTFIVQAELRPRVSSTFRLVGTRKGTDVPLEPGSVTVRHGISLADPPLSRTIGVALADGGVAVYFERGAPLPSRRTFRLRTSLGVRQGERGTAISVPVVQGEVALAHLCRLVGTIDIRPESLRAPLPAGSPVDVVLELDRGGSLTASAHLPEQGLTFPGVLVLVSPDASVDELEAQLGRMRAKLEGLYAEPHLDQAAQKKLVAIDAQLDDALGELEAARGADPDAIEKARRMLIDADGSIADVDALRVWPDLERRAMASTAFAMSWISRTGTDMERSAFDELLRSLDRARAVRNAAELSKRLDDVVRMGEAACMRDPDVVGRSFRQVCTRIGEMRDPRAARSLVAEGEKALAANDTAALRTSVYRLWDLLPPTEEVRARAHGSGVEK